MILHFGRASTQVRSVVKVAIWIDYRCDQFLEMKEIAQKIIASLYPNGYSFNSLISRVIFGQIVPGTEMRPSVVRANGLAGSVRSLCENFPEEEWLFSDHPWFLERLWRLV